MSTINTNGIDVNYPVPGQNNSTQGFRNNFTNIKQNLNIAASEISDLQNKVVLKTALANSTLNNDMANTLIANASTLQFRATTYNLGNALANTVIVNCALGDVQYGNLAGDIVLQFGSWAPVNTQSTVKLQLGRPTSSNNFTITFPGEAVFGSNYGWTIVENSSNANGNTTLSFPYDVTQLNFTLTSNDCGNTIFVEPSNRPFQTTQIQTRTPSPTGFLGDVAGTVAVDANYLYVCTDTFDSTLVNATAVSTTTGTNIITFDAVLPGTVVANMPVIFDTMSINGNSTTTFAGINSGEVYYVKTVSGSDITISDSRTGGVAGTTLALSTVAANSGNTSMDATFYSGSNIWKRVSLTSW